MQSNLVSRPAVSACFQGLSGFLDPFLGGGCCIFSGLMWDGILTGLRVWTAILLRDLPGHTDLRDLVVLRFCGLKAVSVGVLDPYWFVCAAGFFSCLAAMGLVILLLWRAAAGFEIAILESRVLGIFAPIKADLAHGID
jgi:hypothetical protein